MRRILLLIIAVTVAAYAGWYYWNLSQRISSAPVAGLLPRDTIFLAHMPDFNRTREEWFQSDIYQLYREPAVQDFLRKPLGNVQKQNPVSQTLQEMEQLDRVDHRAKNPGETLDKDEAYRTAISHRPSNYAASFYLQPKAFSERLAALRAAVQSSPTPGETTMLEKMRCIAGSTRFENG